MRSYAADTKEVGCGAVRWRHWSCVLPLEFPAMSRALLGFAALVLVGLALVAWSGVASSADPAPAAKPSDKSDFTPEMLLGGALDPHAPERAALVQAIQQFQAKAFDEAYKSIVAAAAAQPKLPPAEVLMARLCFAFQQLPQGRGWLERAAVASPGDPETYILLGGLAMREGRMTEADLLLRMAQAKAAAYSVNPARKAELEGRSADGVIAVAEARQQWPEVERLLRERREKQPAAPGIGLRIARALFAQRKVSDAEGVLKTEYETARKAGDATALRPEINLALLHEEQASRMPEGPDKQALRAAARQQMAAAIKADPSCAATQLHVARWALESGDAAIAGRCAADAAKLAKPGDPLKAQAQWIGALAAHLSGDLPAAEKQLRELTTQAPEDSQLRNQLAIVLAERTEAAAHDEALKLAEQNAKLLPLSTPAGRNVAVTQAFALHRLGRAAEADKVLSPVVEGGGLAGDAWYLTARIYADRGDKARARQILQPVVESQVVFLWRDKARVLLDSLK